MNAEQRAEALRLDADRPLITVSNIEDYAIVWSTKAAALLRTLAAEPQGEPVAWRWSESKGERWFDWTTDWDLHRRAKATKDCLIEYAYPAPPQTPLTEDDIRGLWHDVAPRRDGNWILLFARAIERAHGIGEKP